MAFLIPVSLTQEPDDLITQYGAGAKVYLDSATSEGGSYSNVGSEAIVAGQTVYEILDTAGTSSTWYKSRPGDSAGSTYGAYSDPYQATSLLAYASLMDLRETGDWAGTTRDNLLLDLLVDGKEQIDAACGRTFLRDPQVSGTTTVYVDIDRSGCDSLVTASRGGFTTDGRPLDIVSVSSVGIRDSESDATYTTISAGDTGYYLDPGDGLGTAGVDWPYADIVLSPQGSTHTTYPVGKRIVELTLVLGFPRPPARVKRANIDLAREAYRQGPGGGPSQQGINQFGVPVFLSGAPQSFRALTATGSKYVRRTYANV